MNFLLVLRGVFSHVVKTGIWVMSFLEYLADLNNASGSRESCNMQARIFLGNQRVGQHVDVIGVPIS